MKQKSTLLNIKAIISSGICIGLLFTAEPVFAAGKPYQTYIVLKTGIEEGSFSIGKEKNNSIFLRNNNSVKIYLDGPKKKVHIIAKENKGKQIDFFVFDLEGTLVHNHKMKTKDHHRVTNLSKGIYVYRVFCGDEETASGQFEIK